MKKFAKVFLAVLMAVSLAGCAPEREIPEITDKRDFSVTSGETVTSAATRTETERTESTAETTSSETVQTTSETAAETTTAQTAAEITETVTETERTSPQTTVTETAAPETTTAKATTTVSETSAEKLPVEKDGSYTTPEDVAEYIHTFGTLPKNFITKEEARALGWDNKKGNLWDVADGKSIGGDYFGNYEGLLPAKKGRKYTECDVNYSGGYRGAERIIFSNDGLIFYTDDHYESFTQLY